MPRDSIGEFEKLVLLAILRLERDAYGATIVQEIEERTGRSASPGAVYVALRRLEEKRLVASEEGESAPERGGRPKRYSRLTRAGLEALRRSRAEWVAMSRGLEDRLGEAGS